MKNNLLQYKGYYGTTEVDQEDGCLMGKILHINDLVTYEAETVPELINEFEKSVDDYLALCKELGREPQKPFNGSFNIRISSKSHKQLSLKAIREDCSINEIVKKAVDQCLANDSSEIVHNHKVEFKIKLETPAVEGALPNFPTIFKYSDEKFFSGAS